MKKLMHLLFLLAIPLILSCWNGSSPTSDKSETFKVSGSVIDKNGAGIEGVAVKISGTGYSTAETTNALGTFLFNDVSSGSYKIQTSSENRVFKPSEIEITVSDSDIDTLKFITAENRVHGRVIDIITNKGILDIRIIIDSDSFEDSTKTDSNGEYEFFDLPVSDYSIRTNFFEDAYRNGYSFPPWHNLKPEDFVNSEVSVPAIYMSSEVLQIKTATFSEETNTVHLEWTPSKSNYCDFYVVLRTDKLPLGSSYNTGGDQYQTNYAFIEITPKYLAPIKNAKIIHYTVSAHYFVDRQTYIEFTGPYSEPVSIRDAE